MKIWEFLFTFIFVWNSVVYELAVFDKALVLAVDGVKVDHGTTLIGGILSKIAVRHLEICGFCSLFVINDNCSSGTGWNVVFEVAFCDVNVVTIPETESSRLLTVVVLYRVVWQE